MLFPVFISLAAFAVFVVVIAIPFFLRKVVAPNEVHIVQSRQSTKSYGKDTPNGNTYYEWPHWLPVIGVTKIMLPVSVFDLTLNAYEAYDVGRVPFVVDVTAFFRVQDSNLAAQRVESFSELQNQLKAIVQGAIRTVLASHDIDAIMLERSRFGEHFTEEVKEQLKSWGVICVKNIELMDIRDLGNNAVIHNIMEKKKSLIEMQSRTEVAENMKRAKIAEIEAARETEIQNQKALQEIGQRTAEKEKMVGIANEQARQEIKTQERETREREMAVLKVQKVRDAEIAKESAIVKADEDKQTTILIAEGDLEAKRKEAEGIKVEGEARADAERAMQLAPVMAQIELAREIGSNDGYQKYLISIRAVEAHQVIGIEQAGALEKADVKIIANTGNSPTDGMNNVMDVFSAKGGTNIGAALEAVAQTEYGHALLAKLGISQKVPKGNGAEKHN